jgi:hypothetical protein
LDYRARRHRRRPLHLFRGHLVSTRAQDMRCPNHSRRRRARVEAAFRGGLSYVVANLQPIFEWAFSPDL